MTAILILVVAGVLAWLYGKWVAKIDGEDMMTIGPALICIPWLLIAIGTIVALVLWS